MERRSDPESPDEEKDLLGPHDQENVFLFGISKAYSSHYSNEARFRKKNLAHALAAYIYETQSQPYFPRSIVSLFKAYTKPREGSYSYDFDYSKVPKPRKTSSIYSLFLKHLPSLEKTIVFAFPNTNTNYGISEANNRILSAVGVNGELADRHQDAWNKQRMDKSLDYYSNTKINLEQSQSRHWFVSWWMENGRKLGDLKSGNLLRNRDMFPANMLYDKEMDKNWSSLVTPFINSYDSNMMMLVASRRGKIDEEVMNRIVDNIITMRTKVGDKESWETDMEYAKRKEVKSALSKEANDLKNELLMGENYSFWEKFIYQGDNVLRSSALKSVISRLYPPTKKQEIIDFIMKAPGKGKKDKEKSISSKKELVDAYDYPDAPDDCTVLGRLAKDPVEEVSERVKWRWTQKCPIERLQDLENGLILGRKDEDIKDMVEEMLVKYPLIGYTAETQDVLKRALRRDVVSAQVASAISAVNYWDCKFIDDASKIGDEKVKKVMTELKVRLKC